MEVFLLHGSPSSLCTNGTSFNPAGPCLKKQIYSLIQRPRKISRNAASGISICPIGVRASFASEDGLASSSTTVGSNERLDETGGTRLTRVLRVRQRQLLGKINEGRRALPMKVFLVLLGYYAANALATILGQTGDWDVLVAGIVVAIIELIGSLLYQKGPIGGPLRRFLVMLNYWKAGFTLGLFVDAFKVGS